MEYHYFTATDFAADENFIQWVQQPTRERKAFWEKYLEENPGQRQAIQEARQLVLHLSADNEPALEQDLEDIWARLSEAREHYLSHGEEEEGDNVIPIRFWQRSAIWIAAAVSALLLVSGYLLLKPEQKQAEITYATTTGERLRLHLPDSSFVVLNANSSITLPATWGPNQDRAVQLEGQAFFSVTHKLNSQRFVVSTADGLEVEVLGTEFSVSNKEHIKRVILERGKVNLHISQNGERQQLTMAPGDLVEATEATGVAKRRVNPELYNAWKNTSLVFENNTLEEVAQLLEHSYGYTVHISGQGLATQRITAYLNTNSPSHILSTLSETLEVEIQQQNKTITISNKL
ncbi:FecR family protein [Pontibacter actiniarum]|uniref:FecR protein domain-containing protein n=1 Tax=Pontibacter actiniarum TaxID=323450 RepID=A0A1X9YRT8_9BACT|nr:FecR domain-containing protein [Pontibacter actiniarum]ARS35573.1 hypothetical protein CA264_09050 [Pontibacter actiniarum]